MVHSSCVDICGLGWVTSLCVGVHGQITECNGRTAAQPVEFVAWQQQTLGSTAIAVSPINHDIVQLRNLLTQPG